MAPAQHRQVTAQSPDHKGVLVIEVSVEQEVVSCFRCEGDECPKCAGSGFRARKGCAGCGEHSGRPSRGGKALMGLRNNQDGALYCMDCHPELGNKDRIGLETALLG